MRLPEPYDLEARRYAKELDGIRCDKCGEVIQSEDCYDIDGAYWCDECIQAAKKDTELIMMNMG